MIYRHIKHSSRLSTIEVIFDGGLRAEFSKAYPNGIAHFMEHLRFRGTEKYDWKTLREGLSRIGAQWNAYTSEDFVSYHMTIPEENIEQAFDYLSQIALYPTFPADEIEKERGIVKQEIRMYKDYIQEINKEDMFSRIFNNFLSNSVQGTEKSVDSITRQHILDFNKDFYNNNRMLCMVGQNDYRELAEKYFGDIDDSFSLTPSSKVKYAEPFKRSIDKEGFEQSSLIISYGGDVVEELRKNSPCRQVFNHIFGGTPDSRLSTKIREEFGLVYGIGSYLQETVEGSLYSIFTLTQKENLDKVIEETNKVINDMKSDKVDGDELVRAKNMIKSSIYSMLESSARVCEREIEKVVYGRPDINTLVEEIEKVGTDDVLDMANTIFSGKCYIQSAVGDK